MVSTSFASFSSSSALFMGSKVSFAKLSSIPARVQLRPLRVSASCTSTAERTISHVNVSPSSSLYEVLGIQMGATCQEIKAAYRRLARVLHPDVSANGQSNGTANDFIKVHEAYVTLSDPEKRADYDRTLLFRARRSFAVSASAASVPSCVASGFSGCTRRSWETDQCW